MCACAKLISILSAIITCIQKTIQTIGKFFHIDYKLVRGLEVHRATRQGCCEVAHVAKE